MIEKSWEMRKLGHRKMRHPAQLQTGVMVAVTYGRPRLWLPYVVEMENSGWQDAL